MGRKNCKFVGAFVEKRTKDGVQKLAKKLDRPNSWVLRRALESGVTHLENLAARRSDDVCVDGYVSVTRLKNLAAKSPQKNG